MAKLPSDYIEWVLKLNATQVEEEYHKLDKANKSLKASANATRKAMVELEERGMKGSQAWKNLKKSLTEYNREIAENRAKMAEVEKRFDTSRMSIAQLNKRLKELTKEFNNTSKAADPKRYDELQKEIKRVRGVLEQAKASTLGLRESFFSLDKAKQTLMGFFTSLGMMIMSQVVGAFKNLVSTIQDFEKANSKLASVLGTSMEGVSKLTEQAKYLGRTTTATASQVTQLQTELAKLGFTQDVIEKMTPAVLKFAKSVDTDLASAAAFAGAAMRMFDKDASEAEEVMASFAVATTKSALDFNKLQASLATVGPVAHNFGISLEDTTALLGKLSDAGFDASSAATATRNILLNLADANGDLAKALGGPVKTLDEMAAGMIKLEEEGIDLQKALELTDKRSVAAFLTILKGADNVITLRDSITGCTDDFNQMSATMADNAAGSWAGFESAVEGLILKFFDFREALKTLYEWGTATVNWLGTIIDLLSPLIVPFELLVKVAGALVVALGNAVGVITKFVDGNRVLKGIVNGVVGALVAYKVAVLASSLSLTKFTSKITAACAGITTKEKVVTAATIKQWAWNTAMNANPIGIIIMLLGTLIPLIVGYNTATDKAVGATDRLSESQKKASDRHKESSEAQKKLNENLATEKNRILELVKVAENENLSKERRLKAISELNKICPEYNGHLDTERNALIANKKALDQYIASMEKRMRLAYYKDEYEKYIRDIEDNKRAMQKAYEQSAIYTVVSNRAKGYIGYSDESSAREAAFNDMWREYQDGKFDDDKPLKSAFEKFEELHYASLELAADFGDLKVDIHKAGLEIEDVLADQVEQPLNNVKNTASETITRLKEITEELRRLRKMDPESDEELDRIQKRIKLLQEEKKELIGKSTVKEVGTYARESISEIEAPVKQSHNARQAELDNNRQTMKSTEYTRLSALELQRYYSELIEEYKHFAEDIPEQHTATLDKIAEKVSAAQAGMRKATEQYDAAIVQDRADLHQQIMESYDAAAKAELERIQESVADREITQEAANVYILRRDKQLHEDRLSELHDYMAEVAASDKMSVDDKKKLMEKLAAEIRKTQSEILTDTGKYSELMRGLMSDITSAEGIKKTFDFQRKGLESLYDSVLKDEKLSAEERIALETEKQRRIAALNYQYQEQMWQLQELVGLSWADEYARELSQLENYHRQGLTSTKNYEKKKLQLGVDNAKKYFDFYANLSGSTFSAIQDAEIAKSDAKYDVLIQQAKNNGEDTAALEEEKENRKLEIQKKYADVNFAIKVSQIVADTAVSIMKAFADLGPIGGAIAAAMLTATGAAQVASAKAERDKIRNLQPSRTATSAGESAPATAQRVLSGFSEGGYTGDGDRYEVAGVVHRGEYVVPKPIMANPRVVDAVGTIEAIRRTHAAIAPSASGAGGGFADGGFTGSGSTFHDPELVDSVKELRKAIDSMRGMRAYVVYSDIERAGKDISRARAPFTRNR